MFLNKIDGPLIERAKAYKQMTSLVMMKIVKKLKDSEAFLASRCLTMTTIRKENGQILEKIKSIRQLVITIKEKISRKKPKSITSPNDSMEMNSGARISISKNEKNKFKNLNLLSAEKTNIQNFMEKALDEQIKEEEINQLNENKVNFEKKFQFNNEILVKMEKENQIERKNLKETQKIYKGFLFRLLNEGKDCRLLGKIL